LWAYRAFFVVVGGEETFVVDGGEETGPPRVRSSQDWI